ncbi:LysE family transporter [Streptomyces atriruber]|uniref:LysE family transporter n=1 Tax=Streptomyces atriruber TaxID=545121 RepID=UPI00099E3B50|nr:LysE family transporter [Streptomyces atriruber]
MRDAMVSGLVAGYALALPVGAIAVLMISLAAQISLRVGVLAALGIATADGVYAVVAVVGGAAAARAIEPFTTPLSWIAALVLLALAVRIAVTALRRRRDGDAERPTPKGVLTRPSGAFIGFLAMTLLNPFTIIYFASLVVSRQDGRGVEPAAEGGYVVAVFTASASWFVLLAVSGAMFGRLITGRRGQVVTGLVSSLIIGGMAVNVLLST